MSEAQQNNKRGFHLSTASWVAIVVGIVMLATGVVFDIDARSVHQQYDDVARSVTTGNEITRDLLKAATQNATNIANLTTALHDLKMLVEAHIMKDGGK